MPQVSVTINGRRFRMACENGEEPRLMRLAEDLDARIAKLRARFGDIGDTRLPIMAALALADELSEMKEKLQRLQPEMRGTPQSTPHAYSDAMFNPALLLQRNSWAARAHSSNRSPRPHAAQPSPSS